MNVTQLSVFMENKPGHLQKILNILSENSINITALTISDTADFGILRMIVDDPEKGKDILKKDNITSRLTNVLAIEVEDKPGALYRVINTFTEKEMNIEYMYGFPGKKDNKCIMVFKFADIKAAENAITAEGYTVLEKTDINGE